MTNDVSGPNPFGVLISIVRSLVKVDEPRFGTRRGPSHTFYGTLLERLARNGMAGLAEMRSDLEKYLAEMEAEHPSTLSASAALAFWLNVYNAGALRLAATAADQDVTSVLRVPGGFSTPIVTIEGESLSLDAMEHGKIRRFGDPRVHGALVCGSVSCPTLRSRPYVEDDLAGQLDDQMGSFLATGGASYDPASNTLHLSRVFLWYGSDFVRPGRMPTFVPARRRQVAIALRRWMADEPPVSARVAFGSYDWGLRCAIG